MRTVLVVVGLVAAAFAAVVSAATRPPALPTVRDVPTNESVQYEPNDLVVRFKPGVTDAEINALLAHDGVVTVLTIPHLHSRLVRVAPEHRDAVEHLLASSPLVARAELDEVLQDLAAPNDIHYANQWGVRLADFPAAWAEVPQKIVLVAVVDTGVDARVPELAGRLAGTIDLVKDGRGPDPNGHGTSVAGVIAARANNHQGGVGACPVCRILSVRVLDAQARGDSARTADGIMQAADRGARVINVSLGGAAPWDELEQAIVYANTHGALVIAAAGNSGSVTPNWPARYETVLSVGASTEKDRLYAWSQHGAWVKVSAPGCNVAPNIHRTYEMFCGTSAAAPLVTAEAALMFAARPNATPAQVAAKIVATSRRIARVKHGRIDAGRAVAAIR